MQLVAVLVQIGIARVRARAFFRAALHGRHAD
jgi:hypothetical protein